MKHRIPTVRALGLAWLLALLLGGAPLAFAAESPALSGVVNVNTATAEELQILPGIGEARARAILDARKARGGFQSVEELVAVRGIGNTALERLRPFVAVKGKTTAQVR